MALGDLNEDHRDDLILGAAGASPNSLTSAGAAYAVLMPDPLPATVDLATAAAIVLAGADSYDKLGTAVGAADLDQDGVVDVLAGAPNGDPPGRPQAESCLPSVVPRRRSKCHHRARSGCLRRWSIERALAWPRAISPPTSGSDLIVGAPRAELGVGPRCGQRLCGAGALSPVAAAHPHIYADTNANRGTETPLSAARGQTSRR